MSEIQGDVSLPSPNVFMSPDITHNHIQVLQANWLGEKENATENQTNIRNYVQNPSDREKWLRNEGLLTD